MKILKDYLHKCSVYGVFLPTKLFVLKFLEKYLNVDTNLRQEIIIQFLRKNFDKVICNYRNVKEKDEKIPQDAPIWFCWYQGEDSMPEIVKSCLASIKRNAGSHPLMVLDYRNLKQYVTFPKHIEDRLNRGDFNLIYLSDFLRNYLLSEYGGIWLDTTIYALNPINLSNLTFWTVKRKCTNKRFVSRQRWTGFAMAGTKGNPLNSFVRDVLTEYHMRFPVLIDHFLIDYTIALGYHEISCIRQMLDQLPNNNTDLYYLQSHIYDVYDEERIATLKRTHFLQKLHHRYKGDGRTDTYYYHIVNNDI